MKTLLDDITLERCAKAHPSFVEELNDEMREKILEKMIFSSYEKGEVLFQEGDKADWSLYYSSRQYQTSYL